MFGGDDSGVSRAEGEESVSWSGPGSGGQMLEVSRSSGQGLDVRRRRRGDSWRLATDGFDLPESENWSWAGVNTGTRGAVWAWILKNYAVLAMVANIRTHYRHQNRTHSSFQFSYIHTTYAHRHIKKISLKLYMT